MHLCSTQEEKPQQQQRIVSRWYTFHYAASYGLPVDEFEFLAEINRIILKTTRVIFHCYSLFLLACVQHVKHRGGRAF